MYADVYEFDVTRGRAVGEDTRRYFKALGAGGDVDFQQAMEVVAAKQIHQEFQQGFLAVFAREKVLEAFYNGIRELNYEAMMNTHWEEYHWVRIRARLFFWNVDQSVHMVLYNQDVHEEKERECRLLQDCLIDPLTGLYNRRFIEERLDKLVKSLSRTKGVLSILLIDVDFFKKYNDTYGHSMGDTCLKEVAGVLRGAAKREEDYVARYGGEEFIVILPNTDAAGACIVAEMLLWRMTACAIPHEKSEIADCVTISIGGVTGAVTYACDMREYLQVADKALYASKARGRNCYTGEMV